VEGNQYRDQNRNRDVLGDAMYEDYVKNSDGSISPSGRYTNPVNTGYRSSDYVYGSPEENITKTAMLRKLAKLDPGQARRIQSLTNQVVGRYSSGYVAGLGPRKDMYALGQDAYLKMMNRYLTDGDEEENPNTMRKMSAKVKGR
jgi:hypothetical protein